MDRAGIQWTSLPTRTEARSRGQFAPSPGPVFRSIAQPQHHRNRDDDHQGTEQAQGQERRQHDHDGTDPAPGNRGTASATTPPRAAALIPSTLLFVMRLLLCALTNPMLNDGITAAIPGLRGSESRAGNAPYRYPQAQKFCRPLRTPSGVTRQHCTKENPMGISSWGSSSSDRCMPTGAWRTLLPVAQGRNPRGWRPHIRHPPLPCLSRPLIPAPASC